MTKQIICPYCKEPIEPLHLSKHIKEAHGEKIWNQWINKVLEKPGKSERDKNFTQ